MKPLGDGDPLRLGPYRLLGVLGAGGMGKVYVGRDAAGELAAVKVLRRELAHDAHMVRRFQREGQAAQAVRSRGVARVLAMETEVGRLWIATEFLAGPTLDEAVEAYGTLDEDGLRALGAALARTLRDVHRADLVHRDVKPPNIVLTADGPRLIDFGIARPEHGLTLTTTGQTPATPGYAPPEQVLGRRTGPAADLFALGAVLVYAATGRLPFGGTSVPTIQYEVVHGSPDLGGVPQALHAPLTACLAKEAADRPTPAELVRTLAPPAGADRLWKRGPLAQEIGERRSRVRQFATLPSTGTGTGAGESPGRRRVLAALGVGGAVLATGGTAWWLLRDSGSGSRSGGDPTDPSAYAAPPLDDFEPGIAPEPLWTAEAAAHRDSAPPLPVGNRVLLTAPGGGVAAYHVVDGARRWVRTDLRGAAGIRAGRGPVAVDADGVLHLLDPADGRDVRTLDRAPAVALLLAVDGEVCHVLTEDGELAAVGPDGTVAWSVEPPAALAGDAHFARVAEGRLVLCGTDRSVHLLDTVAGRTLWSLPARGGAALAPAVTPQGVVVGGRELTCVEFATGREIWTRPAVGDSPWGAPTASGAAFFVTAGADLQHLRTATGEEIWTSRTGETPSTVAPVVAGRTVWVAGDERESAGVAALLGHDGSHAWPYTRGRPGRWGLTAHAGRMHLLQDTTLIALPHP